LILFFCLGNGFDFLSSIPSRISGTFRYTTRAYAYSSQKHALTVA
jgi:hypothetical protein